MKKILIVFVALILSINTCCAQGLTFIYINGSNNNNSRMKNWFYKGVYKLHPTLKKAFEKNAESHKYFLENDSLVIETNPKIFFWGDKSKEDLEFLTQHIEITKSINTRIAFLVKYFIASCLHDAIWVQKYHNMKPILADLHQSVLQEQAKGNKVVLYGYSAGAFVTYEYLFHKLPYINLQEFFNRVDITDEERVFVAANPRKNTCIDGLLDAKLTVLSMDGHMFANRNNNLFKKLYLNIDKSTDAVCSPSNTVKGIVNFASPLVLFYSDLADPQYELNFYNKYMYKYIIENNLFWLTVNYREDPLGYPTSKNLTNEEIETIADVEFSPELGFMFDNSEVWSKRTFFDAHTSYWATRKTLSKAIVRTYNNGYKFQYDPEFRAEFLKRKEKVFKF